MTTIPDGSQLLTTFKGYLTDVSQLPPRGAQLGDAWAIGNNFWILTLVGNSQVQAWVDPPVPTFLAHAEWDAVLPSYMLHAYAPYKRYVEIGEGTHNVMIEKNRMQRSRRFSSSWMKGSSRTSSRPPEACSASVCQLGLSVQIFPFGVRPFSSFG